MTRIPVFSSGPGRSEAISSLYWLKSLADLERIPVKGVSQRQSFLLRDIPCFLTLCLLCIPLSALAAEKQNRELNRVCLIDYLKPIESFFLRAERILLIDGRERIRK